MMQDSHVVYDVRWEMELHGVTPARWRLVQLPHWRYSSRRGFSDRSKISSLQRRELQCDQHPRPRIENPNPPAAHQRLTPYTDMR